MIPSSSFLFVSFGLLSPQLLHVSGRHASLLSFFPSLFSVHSGNSHSCLQLNSKVLPICLFPAVLWIAPKWPTRDHHFPHNTFPFYVILKLITASLFTQLLMIRNLGGISTMLLRQGVTSPIDFTVEMFGILSFLVTPTAITLIRSLSVPA